MIYVIIAIGVFFLGFIIYTIVSPMKQRGSYETNLKNALNELGEHELTKVKNVPYDFNLKINNKEYLIKTITVPSFAEVQVNSKTTWEIKYGAGDVPGKAQPFKKYLSNISQFMHLKPNDNQIKVVVVIPRAKKIVMYINECEIVFVTPQTNVHGTRIINCDDFSLFK